MGRTLVDQVERPDVAALRLKDVLTYDTKQAISFFVGLEILKNEKPCDICGAAMLTEKRKERVDGIQWRCLRNKKLCSRKSIRFGTFFGRYVEYKHYTICHKRSFARTVIENEVPLRVHTNKCEGQWMHMKHKIKRLLGTSNANTASYVEEAVFRQNCRASGWDILSKFLEQMYLIYNV